MAPHGMRPSSPRRSQSRSFKKNQIVRLLFFLQDARRSPARAQADTKIAGCERSNAAAAIFGRHRFPAAALIHVGSHCESRSEYLFQCDEESHLLVMKIAHLVSTFPPYQAGIGNTAYHLCWELSQLGHS